MPDCWMDPSLFRPALFIAEIIVAANLLNLTERHVRKPGRARHKRAFQRRIVPKLRRAVRSAHGLATIIPLELPAAQSRRLSVCAVGRIRPILNL
jgi:hypothetical protein